MNFKTHSASRDASIRACAVALAAAFASVAHAQTTVPAPALAPAPATTPVPTTAPATTTAASTVTIPPLQCEKPSDALLIDPTAAHMKRLQKEVDDYKVCVNAYSHAMGAKANDLAEQSRAYAAAANGAIEGYNTFVTRLNAKAKGDSSTGDLKQSPSSGSKPTY